jgi:hypothetical protein
MSLGKGVKKNMAKVFRILKLIGAGLGAIMTIIAGIQQAREVLSWGLPYWGWQAIGMFIFFASIIAIVYFKVPLIKKKETSSQPSEIDKLNSEVAPYRELLTLQKGHEDGWLYLAVDFIDLGKHTNRPEKEIRVLFHIDSGLLYDIQPYRMWVSPILGGWEASEPEHEIRQTPNLLKCSRSQLSSINILIKDERLWEFVQKIRQGKDITKALKVELQLESGKSSIVLRSYNLYPDRVNDTRQ